MNETTKNVIVFSILGLAIILSFLFMPVAHVLLGLFGAGLLIFLLVNADDAGIPGWVSIPLIVIAFICSIIFLASAHQHIHEIWYNRKKANVVIYVYIAVYVLVLIRMTVHHSNSGKGE